MLISQIRGKVLWTKTENHNAAILFEIQYKSQGNAWRFYRVQLRHKNVATLYKFIKKRYLSGEQLTLIKSGIKATGE